MKDSMTSYRGRIAPTPSGYLHLGHAQTFAIAQKRAKAQGGCLILRVEDLDEVRCRADFTQGLYEDLHWAGLTWDEGPDVGGLYGPYIQSQRRAFYLKAWEVLKNKGVIYACTHSRKDVENATQAPHEEDEAEPIFPRRLRAVDGAGQERQGPAGVNWRFRVPDGEKIFVLDERLGPIIYVAGEDFGDFLVWRRDDVPAYELAVVVDDAEMAITEVVRGEDLLKSTARQLLLYRALGLGAPAFCHVPLVKDSSGKRLAKRDNAMSLRGLREKGISMEQVRGLLRDA